MKLKIKVKKLNKNIKLPQIIDKGEWIDLMSSEVISFKEPYAKTLKRNRSNENETSYRDVVFDFKLISLGVAMQLPKGFEAAILPRSSTFKKFGIIEANSKGIIDNEYCGNNDEWKFPAIAFRNTTIHIGDRICQFRIQLSQKATVWQKLKWLLSSGIKIVEVETLDNTDRGGFGSTGVK